METFRVWLKRRASVPEDAIKVALPLVRQQTNYSCGAAALMAICRYFKIGPDNERSFIKMLDSNSKAGTPPENIAKGAKALGMQVRMKTDMSFKELIKYLDKGIPVICSVQAWGEPKNYDKAKSGHYIVAIGYDDTKIFFEDPSLDGGRRGFLRKKEFDKRWHDTDCHGHDCFHLGIAIWKKTEPDPAKKGTKAKRIE